MFAQTQFQVPASSSVTWFKSVTVRPCVSLRGAPHPPLPNGLYSAVATACFLSAASCAAFACILKTLWPSICSASSALDAAPDKFTNSSCRPGLMRGFEFLSIVHEKEMCRGYGLFSVRPSLAMLRCDDSKDLQWSWATQVSSQSEARCT